MRTGAVHVDRATSIERGTEYDIAEAHGSKRCVGASSRRRDVRRRVACRAPRETVQRRRCESPSMH
jgi:hypothetical protein